MIVTRKKIEETLREDFEKSLAGKIEKNFEIVVEKTRVLARQEIKEDAKKKRKIADAWLKDSKDELRANVKSELIENFENGLKNSADYIFKEFEETAKNEQKRKNTNA